MSEDVFSARRAKLENLRESGDPYPNDFKPDHKVGALCNEHGEKSREQLADEKSRRQKSPVVLCCVARWGRRFF